ncbi:MAG: transposase [Verrucomicrobiota bacterium]
MNRRVSQIVRDKREWQEPPDPAEAAVEQAIGSKGWYTRGYLPHYDKPGTIQMVTFRLADAMPAARRHEWEALLAIKEEREQRTELEAYLDEGYGECVLRAARVAAAVEDVLLRFDGERYRLAAWVVMPNHVHVLVELWEMPLGELLKAWKGTSANAVNRLLGRRGTLWQVEYWDRYMREEAHFLKAHHYIEWNPVKAHLVERPEDWPFTSANPKWQWNGPDRYQGAHLVKDGARTFLSARPADGETGRQECRRSKRWKTPGGFPPQ